MLNKDSADATQQASSPLDPKATLEVSSPDPWSIIEGGDQGSGTTNDPPATDNRPPGVADFDYLA